MAELPRGAQASANAVGEKVTPDFAKTLAARLRELVEPIVGPENPPVNALAELLKRGDPMGAMGMGMAISPAAKAMLGKTYSLNKPIKSVDGLTASKVRVLDEGSHGYLRLADETNGWVDTPLHMRSRDLAAASGDVVEAIDPVTGKLIATGPTYDAARAAAKDYFLKNPKAEVPYGQAAYMTRELKKKR